MAPKKEKEPVNDDIDLENDESIDLNEDVKKTEDQEDVVATSEDKVEEDEIEEKVEEPETNDDLVEEFTKADESKENTSKVKEEVKPTPPPKGNEEGKPTPPSKKKDLIGLTVYDPEPIAKDTPPPPKPKRPLTPRQESFKTLKEAFPTFEDKLIQTVLIASGFRLESSFNALLYYTDPSTVNIEEVAVETTEVIQQQATQHNRAEDLLKQDELLAKQLDEEFKRKERRRLQRQQQQYENQSFQNRQQSDQFNNADDDDDIFTNLIEKDIPQLKQQFNKNLQETKNKFSNWFNNLSSQPSNPEFAQSGFKPQGFQTSKNSNNYNRSSFTQDYEEPEILDMSKFQNIRLNNEEEEQSKPSLPNRNRSGSIELYGATENSANSTKTNTSGSAKKSWEPISASKTTTSLQDDDDDFLLSEDEDRTK